MTVCRFATSNAYSPTRTPRPEMSAEDGETEEFDMDLDDDGWEEESDDEA